MLHLPLLAVALLQPTGAPPITITPGQSLQWDEPGMSVQTAQAAIYRWYADGANSGIVATPLTCEAAKAPLNPASDSTCFATPPPLTAGNHTLALTQSIGPAESGKSVFVLTQTVLVVIPQNLRLR